MSIRITSIIGVDARFQFLSTEHPIWLRDCPFAMHPFRFDRVEPRALGRQQADYNSYSHSALLDRTIMGTKPVSHLLTLVPGRIVPDQEQARDTLSGQPLARPCQKITRNCTDWAPIDKAQQQPIARQSLGVAVIFGPFKFLELHKSIVVGPAMLIWLGQSAPPDFVSKTECPAWMIGRQPN